MKAFFVIAVAAAALAAAKAARANEALIGRYAMEQKFDSAAKASCKSVDAAMAVRLGSQKFHCTPKPTTGTASGRPAMVCQNPENRVEVLVFQSKADCESEIRAAGANND